MEITRSYKEGLGYTVIRSLAWTSAVATYMLIAPGFLIGEQWLTATVGLFLGALCLSIFIWARQERHLVLPVLIALVLYIFHLVQSFFAIPADFKGTLGASHLATTIGLLATILTIAVFSGNAQPNREHPERTRRFARNAITTTILTYGLILSGSYVVNTSGSSEACLTWPLCGAEGFWPTQSAASINMLHRYIAIFVGLMILWTLFKAWKRRDVAPTQAGLAFGTVALFVIQGGIGILFTNNLQLAPNVVTLLHQSLASAVFAGMTLIAVNATQQWAHAPQTVDASTPWKEEKQISPWRLTLNSYINLMKPHVTVLLLGTTLAAMAIAANGLPSLELVIATMIGGALSAGSANSLNCYIDRDIDQIMGRTQRRSLPAGKVKPINALIFGITIGVISFIIFAVFVNMLSALLSTGAILFYVLLYTLVLKRTTAQNIVIGGAAGAVPVLIGWSAVTNSVDLPAIWLFAIVFYWTPPHFWALSLLIEKDYAKAGIPMLPVLMGQKETRRQIFLYTLLLFASTLVLFSTQVFGYFYLISAIILGGILIYMCIRLLMEPDKHWARTIFWYSNCYLALIFAVMVIDRVIQV